MCNDCSHCEFHKFMEMYGFDLNSSNCFVKCTDDIHRKLNNVFLMINDHTFTDHNNFIIYDGNVDPTSDIMKAEAKLNPKSMKGITS